MSLSTKLTIVTKKKNQTQILKPTKEPKNSSFLLTSLHWMIYCFKGEDFYLKTPILYLAGADKISVLRNHSLIPLSSFVAKSYTVTYFQLKEWEFWCAGMGMSICISEKIF